jgi:hypothetical protein
MSAYLLVSLQSPSLLRSGAHSSVTCVPFQAHPAWNAEAGVEASAQQPPAPAAAPRLRRLLFPWLRLAPFPHLCAGLHDLCALKNIVHLVFLK